jgi:hypothetical protein
MKQSFQECGIEVDAGSEVKVQRIRPQALFDLLDLREALVNDYFVKLPFMAVSCLFDVAAKQYAAFPEASPMQELF